MHSNDLEACGMMLCCFWFHSDVKFLTRSLYSGERQWPTWASCFCNRYVEYNESLFHPGLWLSDICDLFLEPLSGIRRNLTGSKIVTSFTKFRCFGPDLKTMSPWPLIVWHIFDFSASTEQNFTKPEGGTISITVLFSTSSTKPLICLDIFDFFSATAERNCKKLVGGRISTSLPGLCFSVTEPKAQVHYCDHALSVRPALIFTFSNSKPLNFNSTKLDRKQDLNVLYHVCAFWADRKNKIATLASN